MIKTKKKINTFSIILIIILSTSTSIILLSIPVIFNYKSLESKIEKEFYSQFKINLKILGKINYLVFPRPHLFIDKANLNLNISNDGSSVIETNNIKIFIPINNIFSKKNIKIESVEVNNINVRFKIFDIKEFRNHLFYKINKPIKIKKSKFFYLDKNNNIILISPIYKLDYFIDIRNKIKKLKIKGNFFDINYSSLWKKNYNYPKETFNEIKFKKPNILINNLFSFQDDSNFSGNSSINFLGENININYFVKQNKIILKSNDDIKNQQFVIDSVIELNPFYFNSKITLLNKDSKFIIDYLLNYLSNYSKDFLGNLNGEVILHLKNLNNEIINNGKIRFIINEKTLNISEALFDIESAGTIKSNFKYYIDQGDVIFNSSNLLEIKNKEEFAKKFFLSKKRVKKINKIYFDLSKNINTGEFLISNIQLNKLNLENVSEKIYVVKNFKELKSLIKKTLP